MLIKSFRIKNYRSIKDSGDCYLSADNMTIFAGKNESGKTAILEALEDFNTNKQIRKDAIPLYNQDTKPEVSIKFELYEETLNEMLSNIGLPEKVTKPANIEIKKTYPNEYTYFMPKDLEAIFKRLDAESMKSGRNDITTIYNQIKATALQYPQIAGSLPKLQFDDLNKLTTEFQNFRNTIQPTLPNITDEHKSSLINGHQQLVTILNNIKRTIPGPQQFFANMKEHIPNFILFSAFDDVFPSEIPLAEAPNNPLIKDLDIISDLNLELIQSGSAPTKKRHKERLNFRLQEDYRIFWDQDLTNLCIDWDSANLQFFISENDYYYPPNMRSKGKQWHLAFYVRVSARAKEDVPNIILIDEPGLYLHAQAQKNIIKKLEDAAADAPIIFGTHSPYLIDVNKLHRIRLISKPSDEEGTIISNKIHKDADIETLTPIITAIGLDLSIGLDIAKDNNIIFEGITDYYYLLAFIAFLKFKFHEEVHFIPGAGADKLNLLASLMIGWSFNYCIILDNDAKGRRIKDRLEKDFNAVNIKIQQVSESKDEEIEDLFEREDFIKHILNQNPETFKTDKANSQIIKQKGTNYDKVLLSKLFYEKVTQGSISLSPSTRENFKKLLNAIDTRLFPQ